MDVAARNEVLLVGRLAAAVEERELPSGDSMTTFRLVVERPPSRRPGRVGARQVTIDTLDCVAWTPAQRKSAAGWEAGDVLEVQGALRRRFWRAPGGGLGSRYEVEVERVKRLARVAKAA